MIKRSNLFAALLDKVVNIPVIQITLLVVLFFFVSMFSLSAQTPRKDSGADGLNRHEIIGLVISDKDNRPLQGVSIHVDAENLQIRSAKDGSFQLLVRNAEGKIRFTSVGFKSQEVNYTAGTDLVVRLVPEDNKLEEVEVVSTGYQKIPKERATGSFEFVDNKLLNRKVSTDFVSRLEDMVPSIASTKVLGNRGDLLNINIRGVNTLQSARWPLVVIDGVPYESNFADFGRGAFNNINPNDIENITILKDVAASSIWGAQSNASFGQILG